MSWRCILSVAFVGLAASATYAAAQSAKADFNGDGFSDLVVRTAQGLPGKPFTTGTVHVLYGTTRGLSAEANQFWTPLSPGMLGTPFRDHAFGAALAAGDFNGDGYDDLAIGVPGSKAGLPPKYVGVVNVLYGSAAGLTTDGTQLWSQNSPGILDDGAKHDRFGSALVAADFDGDRFDDLAVSSPGEHVDVGTRTRRCGGVHVIYGTAAGLSSDRNQQWTQNSPDVGDEAEALDAFGSSLAGADFDGDGFADLAIGVPLEDLTGGVDAGLVNVLYGTPAGVSADRQQIWHQDREDILGEADDGDGLGSALATGDLNGDGYQDLAISVPGEDVSGLSNAGAVAVLYGRSSGLTSHGDQLWSQDSPDVLDDAEVGDGFGRALTISDVNGDSFGDLMVGVGQEEVDGSIGAGAVNALFGSSTGLISAGNQFLTENNTGTREIAEPGDAFGVSVVGLDFDADGFGDVAVGVPGDSVGHKSRAGQVVVIYGFASGFNFVRSELWNQDRKGILDKAQPGEGFGGILGKGHH